MTTRDEARTRAEAQVDAGVELLRRTFGRRWYSKVEPERINQASTRDDVLGQICGSYERGMKKLGFFGIVRLPGQDEAVELPFADKGAEHGFALCNEFMTWEILNDVWRSKVAALRASR